MKRLIYIALFVFATGLFAARGMAQTVQPAAASVQSASPAQTAAVAQSQKLEGEIAEAQGAGDNAWMLMCAALVLMMTGPGLALFYGGLVRAMEDRPVRLGLYFPMIDAWRELVPDVGL